jgi:hypothetical protein
MISNRNRPAADNADDLDARVAAAVRRALEPPAEPAPVPAVPGHGVAREVLREGSGRVVGHRVTETYRGEVVRVLELSPAEYAAYVQAGMARAERAHREYVMRPTAIP